MKMILRPAHNRDFPALRKLFELWTDDQPEIPDLLKGLSEGESQDRVHCTTLEADRTLLCASLWTLETPGTVRLWALGVNQSALDTGVDVRFLREEILDWAEMGIEKVVIMVPKHLSRTIIRPLRACGFLFEGIAAECALDSRPRFRLTKYFLYRSIAHSEVMGFLKDFMLSLGYEVRPEGEGFGYRIGSEYRLPFMFNAWHRITRSGREIIVHPPARILEMHELETIFYPLRIRTAKEKPLLLPLDRKRALSLIDLPDEDVHQGSLFHDGWLHRFRPLFLNDLTYGYPAGLKGVRKGLPILFYVNRVGVVGSGRVEHWYLDEPRNLYNQLDEMGFYDPEDVKECAASSGPSAGKVLVIRFHWYRPLRRPVALEQLRELDVTFNPQRTRALSTDLFDSILAAGNT
ncbi:MAG: hypothetical protein RDU20_14485 [Desulfomonilaceae bacterium]|nr:hypothetical protein [Desulfomonilaceae bacterium]